MRKNGTIRLSPSTIGLYKDCKRCFWLKFNGRERPAGIFPSLPSGMDGVIKKYFDKYRGGMPPELQGRMEGILMHDLTTLNKWRNWRTGLVYEDKTRNAALFGALDDCLEIGDNYAPLDYKTRGFAPKDGGEAYYQHQLDAYTFLLRANNYKVADFAYLVYYYPEKVEENGVVYFNVEPKKVAVNTDDAKKSFEDAVDFLKEPEPKVHSYRTSCAYCNWQINEEFD
ncbi:MAG: hypothetical protein A2932_01415 [Candidatus Spechtbacteria bacterium RIFCSPLOWO2_01_FULL_46_10]|uniref:PD-(D/E)XK endonuclease-like domain-containing protein n=1 Tax=Candidatus Spechtbacteria bacterium RIFCSPLOWO2_01_FULL_46_10 TaxID=1802163 RepID=A0A1G2HGT1_9BACT|nr:MAG: hypothetical protein A2932_01415 [Candidatus Spechtbacteria bacterium RIFCSPLOWO2_01_FULL_46_10]